MAFAEWTPYPDTLTLGRIFSEDIAKLDEFECSQMHHPETK
jgi:hypothetical protein